MHKAIRRIKKNHRNGTDPGLIISDGATCLQGHPSDIINMLIREMRRDPENLALIIEAAFYAYRRQTTFERFVHHHM